jgi:DNA-binding MarR family transcriptional regulator
MAAPSEVSSHEYRALAEFRYQIRRFLRFSEDAARAAGLEPQQHQLLLAVKGLPEGSRCTISEIAERLQIQHHSTVELVDRLVKHGYVQRRRDAADRRQVLLQVTARGERILRELAVHHEEVLRRLGPALISSLRRMMATPRGPQQARLRLAGVGRPPGEKALGGPRPKTRKTAAK